MLEERVPLEERQKHAPRRRPYPSNKLCASSAPTPLPCSDRLFVPTTIKEQSAHDPGLDATEFHATLRMGRESSSAFRHRGLPEGGKVSPRRRRPCCATPASGGRAGGRASTAWRKAALPLGDHPRMAPLAVRATSVDGAAAARRPHRLPVLIRPLHRSTRGFHVRRAVESRGRSRAIRRHASTSKEYSGGIAGEKPARSDAWIESSALRPSRCCSYRRHRAGRTTRRMDASAASRRHDRPHRWGGRACTRRTHSHPPKLDAGMAYTDAFIGGGRDATEEKTHSGIQRTGNLKCAGLTITRAGGRSRDKMPVKGHQDTDERHTVTNRWRQASPCGVSGFERRAAEKSRSDGNADPRKVTGMEGNE